MLLPLGCGGGGPTSPTPPPDTRIVETFAGSLCGFDYAQKFGGCAFFATYDISVTAQGTLDAAASWPDARVYFWLELKDERWDDITMSHNTAGPEATLRAQVTSQKYHLSINRTGYVNGGLDKGPVAYQLTVRHP